MKTTIAGRRESIPFGRNLDKAFKGEL